MSITSTINLSVIIIGRNASNTLNLCLQSIQKSIRKSSLINTSELIYVDSNSSDHSVSIAQTHQCQTIEIIEGFTTAALGRALGKDAAQYEHLMFVDADMEIEEDWLEKSLPKLLKYGAIIGEGIDYIYKEEKVIRESKLFGGIDAEKPAKLVGGFLMISKTVLKEANYTPLVESEEEADLYAQFIHRNLIYQIPEIAYRHHNYVGTGIDKLLRFIHPYRSIGYLYSFIHSIRKGYFKGYFRVQRKYIFNALAFICFYIALFTLNPLFLIPWAFFILMNGLLILKGSIIQSILMPYKIVGACIFYSSTKYSLIKQEGAERRLAH